MEYKMFTVTTTQRDRDGSQVYAILINGQPYCADSYDWLRIKKTADSIYKERKQTPKQLTHWNGDTAKESIEDIKLR